MPRTTWIAAGAIVAASLAAYADPPFPVIVALAISAAGVAAAARRVGAKGLTAAALVAALILIRASFGQAITPEPAPAAAPDAASPGFDHEAVVISLNAPSNGQQRAVLELRPPDLPDRVWASLPAYPEVAVGDVVRFGGTLEAAPDDAGFGAFLARSGIGYTTSARALERLGDDGTAVAQLEQARRGPAAAH